jgi:hypothetical protein
MNHEDMTDARTQCLTQSGDRNFLLGVQGVMLVSVHP